MVRYIIIFLAVIVSLYSTNAYASTFYIDFDSGNDANAGTSTLAPWKTIPGTRNTANAGWQSANWGGGTINSTNKVPAGTIFKLKSGSTHDKTNGGQIYFDSTYYRTDYILSNPVIIQRDTTWGTGVVTINATGFWMISASQNYAGYGAIHFRIGGVKIDGAVTDGIVIENAPNAGISSYTNTHTVGISLSYIKFYNNGTSVLDTNSAASQGDLQLYQVTGGVIQHCTFDGNGNHMNGIKTGETSGPYVDGLTIDHCIVYNHLCGDAGQGDWGIGIKTHSTSATISNCEMYNNFKGSDNGAKSNSFSPVLKFISNNIHDNVESGINGNGGAAIGYSNTFTAYLINNIIRDNGQRGSYFYDGIMYLYLVHNVYDNNGDPTKPYDSWQLNISNNNSPVEGSTIRAYLYNNIFYKPAAVQNFANDTWKRTTSPISDYNLYSDYNSWVQRASEYMAAWGLMSPSDEKYNFSYGANGPGHASGNWYNYYGASANAPANGALGHHLQDVHSKGTAADDTTEPSFTNRVAHDYSLTTNYIGTDLSIQSWYIPEMGVDRNGFCRTNWNIGAHDAIGNSGTLCVKRPKPPIAFRFM